MPRGVYNRDGRTPADAEVAAEAAPTTEQPVSARAAEMRRERRRRDDGDLDGMAHLKLAIPKEIQEQGKRDGKVFRYFLDTNLHSAFQNDWDKVESADEVLANPMSGGQERLILCSKFKDWHDSDQRKDEQVLDQREQAIMAGKLTGDDGSSKGLHVPTGQSNRITQQRGL